MEIDKANLKIIGLCLAGFLGLVAWSIIVAPNHTVKPNADNTTATNNPYCNESLVWLNPPETDYNHTMLYIENRSMVPTDIIIEIRNISVEVTPTPWDDTRRESVGLPADGFGNPCCPRCTPTPTPTPTGTPVCEFPWWCKA